MNVNNTSTRSRVQSATSKCGLLSVTGLPTVPHYWDNGPWQNVTTRCWFVVAGRVFSGIYLSGSECNCIVRIVTRGYFASSIEYRGFRNFIWFLYLTNLVSCPPTSKFPLGMSRRWNFSGLSLHTRIRIGSPKLSGSHIKSWCRDHPYSVNDTTLRRHMSS